jgi:hypothetical protein
MHQRPASHTPANFFQFDYFLFPLSLFYDLTNKAAKTVSDLDSGTDQALAKSSKKTRTHGNIGASISARRAAINYGIGYDVNLAKKFIGHQGSIKVRVNF